MKYAKKVDVPHVTQRRQLFWPRLLVLTAIAAVGLLWSLFLLHFMNVSE
jgi:hypothetical protein